MKKGFSIIVCCYNSSELLKDTLRSLCSLITSDDFSAEIIIIDNASTDSTSDFAQKLLNEFKCPFDFRIEYEPIQGLSYARKKGIEISAYEYILFCDDDNRLNENYLLNSFSIMENNSEIGALGGVSEPVSDVAFPEWFEDFKQSYSAGRQSDSNGEIKSELHSLWGAGMVLRRKAIEDLYKNGFHSLLSDRTGNALSSGGDTELCYALRLAGWKIWFDDSLKLRHFLPGRRLTWNYLRELNRGFGRQKINFDAYLKNFSSNGKEVMNKDTDWTKRFFFMIKKMRSYGFRKIINFRNHNTGDPEIIRMEKTIGCMQELLRLKNEYGKMITETGKSRWIRHK